ncbi:phosphatase [Zophobihabitans entericus]|uniref:Phosphatase n=1 Tax=Zophobihabitans entericus TaxID=1635327 RepID=A0A6G9I9D9_9GAMM|nr:phosphatase [Zophobihabitans entericus]QIQ20833.1 phosphatase [Zophobihabitans entericus]
MQYFVDLHMHTIASTHAYSTIQEYVQVAKNKGLKLIAITDHGTALGDSPHRWHFINLRIIPRIIDGVAVLRGIESNILSLNGEIDCDDNMYDGLDIVIAGFHEPALAPMDIDKNTEAMIATIKNPKVNIISHPGNPKYPIHIMEVARAAKEHNVALEINNSSFISRKGSDDNCRQVAQAVKDCGGVIALGSDSHVAYTVGNFDHALELIKTVDFPTDRVINRSPKATLEFLAIKTGKMIPELENI